MEWTMLCGWTSTLIRSGGMPKSQRASITSRPLFMSVAESMVIFLPMLQFGCFKAWARVTPAMSCLREVPERAARSGQNKVPDRRGPAPADRHWKMALCSLSTGRSCTPRDRHSAMTSSPAVTSTSLLARAISLACPDRGHRRDQPRRSHDGGNGDVGRFGRRHLDQAFHARQDADGKTGAALFQVSRGRRD